MMMMKKWLEKKERGETLMEVTIAVMVVAMGAATAAVLVVNALRANNFSKNALIGLNLAQEGLEQMRNLRDSNMIKFSYDAENCWNMMARVEDCDQKERIEAGNYYLAEYLENVAEDGEESTEGAGRLDLTDGVADAERSAYLVKAVDLDTSLNSDGNGVTNDDKDVLMSLPQAEGNQNVVEPTIFYRWIGVEYAHLNNDGTVGAASNAVSGEIMLVTSRVEWFGGGRVNSVEVSTGLTRYSF